MRSYLNAGGATGGASGGSGSGAGWSALIDVAVNFGVGYLTAQGEKRKNEELLKKMAQLDKKQAEELKKRINEALTEVAKTQVIIEFLNEEKIKQLEAESKRKRILPLIGLGFGVVLLGLIFYKLSKRNG